jgi:CHAT domain-containing protein
VVASRWNVDSIATEDFMGSFYDSLLSGHDPVEALQAAANSLRHMRGRAHPYYWAAFSVFGGA